MTKHISRICGRRSCRPTRYLSSSTHNHTSKRCLVTALRMSSSTTNGHYVLNKDVDPVASARRSGQEEFQRGTPPVSLASCSISPFLRACIITEWSSNDHETDSTGTSILIPLLLLNFNMRLHGNPTSWYLFLATAIVCEARVPEPGK